ncbi:phosphotransferase enzyme family protein [Ornithinicoccus hortensis]|uniref:Spectinomycin phosphotransferase n=1 Tax=Ornithinicoccus hortensis TaxID=82346 RepID=A0A542YVC1_9MICO|nr:phosphotransferase [Ornithinicoccus hortensis]TQL52029.1 spectinomycin phosphotransferase [Ornithinicoccus hortensis]
MHPTDLAAAFDLTTVEPDPLTRWAPVFRGTARDGAPVVVKRTATEEGRARAMAGWTTRLRGAGLPVVAPYDAGTPNPQQVGQEWWVVYPFEAGAPYAGGRDQLAAAGELLGRLHADPVRVDDLGLREYAFPDSTEEDMEGDLVTLERVLGEQGEAGLAGSVATLGRRWWRDSLPVLRDRADDLVRTGVCSDYKANNLVFTGPADGDPAPVLVDPDNGGVEPRLFDLALAVVLFHNECDGAPGRLFTAAEWQTFATAYLGQVELTPAERELWPAALDHMFWEEGSWALEDNDAQAWADPRQRAFLLDLAAAGPERYPLP